MKEKLSLALLLVTCCLFSGCEQILAPEDVYIDYLAAIQKSSNFDDGAFREYLSEKAVQFVDNGILRLRENPNIPAGISYDEALMISFKSNSVLPEKHNKNVVYESSGRAVLEIEIQDFPEIGSTTIRLISFVSEKGWKIDKIDFTTTGRNEDDSGSWIRKSKAYY